MWQKLEIKNICQKICQLSFVFQVEFCLFFHWLDSGLHLTIGWSCATQPWGQIQTWRQPSRQALTLSPENSELTNPEGPNSKSEFDRFNYRIFLAISKYTTYHFYTDISGKWKQIIWFLNSSVFVGMYII